MIKSIIFALLFVSSAYADNSHKIGAEVVKTAVELIANGNVVIDVRQEACEGYVRGAHLISIELIAEHDPEAFEKIAKLSHGDKNFPLYIYCRSGARAGKVITILETLGYSNLHNLGGVGDFFDPVTMDKCQN